jgi:hypothetical protein
MKRVALICLSFVLATALTLDASAFRGGGGGGFRGGGAGVYRGGGGAGAFRGASGAAVRGRRAAVSQEDRPAGPQPYYQTPCGPPYAQDTTDCPNPY